MHEDVTRITGFAVEVSVDGMLESQTKAELEEAYLDAKEAVDAVYHSMIAKLEDV